MTTKLTNNFKRNLLVKSEEERVRSNRLLELNDHMPCNIEEADERLFLHVKHVVQENHKIPIKTVDSNLVFIALSVFHRILGISEVWI